MSDEVLVTAPTCGWMLGRLPCDNQQLHKGKGKGCTHDAGDVPDRRELFDTAIEP